jgi:trehalose 6-phosphate phosphatase
MGSKYHYNAIPPAHAKAVYTGVDTMNKIPPYLFSAKSDHWNRTAQRIRSASHIALFLDYDGTLTQIRQEPAAAVLSLEGELILRHLSSLTDIPICIVTGRSMEDIRRLIPLDHMSFAANHGFHILHEAKEWIHPDAVSIIQVFSRLTGVLRSRLEPFPKVYVENKQFTLTVHYRSVPSSQVRSLISLVINTIRSFDTSLIITRGKKVIEIRPSISWGKGDAVLQIMKTIKTPRRPVPLFIGDDATDEDVFRVLQSKGITMRVGKNTSTLARYYVKDVEEVLRLLHLVIELRSNRSMRHRTEKKERKGISPCGR